MDGILRVNIGGGTMSIPNQRVVHECSCRICEGGSDLETIAYHRHINLLLNQLNEVQRRWYAGTVVKSPGGPGVHLLARITGLSRNTIIRGRRELETEFMTVPTGRQRQAGGGRPSAEKKTNCSRPCF